MAVLYKMEALCRDNLVYVPITKNASTSYTHFFKNLLGWGSIQTDSIDWDKQHVFAHIMHPYKRHLKGTVQALYQYDLFDIVDDPRFLKLLGTAVFDLHSYPLSTVFAEKMMLIDWIMLDHPHVSSERCVKKLLQEHGIHIDENAIPGMNTSNNFFKKVSAKIENIRDQNDLSGTLTYFYDQDVYWYSQVWQHTLFYEMENLPWSECSWLKNYPRIEKEKQLKSFKLVL